MTVKELIEKVFPLECDCKDEQGKTFTETIVSILPRRGTDTIPERNPESASLSGEIVSPEEPQNAVTDTAIAQNERLSGSAHPSLRGMNLSIWRHEMDRLEQLESLFRCVSKMREYQRGYFRRRSSELLRQAKGMEQIVDRKITELTEAVTCDEKDNTV